jgi:hypothetical protein
LCKKFLDFMATQEEAILTYRTSEMVLAVHSDALYLSEPKARSRAGVTCSWPAMKKSLSTMEPSSTFHR